MPSRPLSFLALALTALSLAACSCILEPENRPRMECQIQPRPPLTAGGPVQIRFALTNPTDETAWVLAWNTPLEQPALGTVFTLTGPGGEEIPYQGPMAKRGEPAREDYVEIAPGGTAEAVVDLAQVYEFKNPGRYRLQVTGDLFDVTADSDQIPRSVDLFGPAPLRCNEILLEVERP